MLAFIYPNGKVRAIWVKPGMVINDAFKEWTLDKADLCELKVAELKTICEVTGISFYMSKPVKRDYVDLIARRWEDILHGMQLKYDQDHPRHVAQSSSSADGKIEESVKEEKKIEESVKEEKKEEEQIEESEEEEQIEESEEEEQIEESEEEEQSDASESEQTEKSVEAPVFQGDAPVPEWTSEDQKNLDFLQGINSKGAVKIDTDIQKMLEEKKAKYDAYMRDQPEFDIQQVEWIDKAFNAMHFGDDAPKGVLQVFVPTPSGSEENFMFEFYRYTKGQELFSLLRLIGVDMTNYRLSINKGDSCIYPNDIIHSFCPEGSAKIYVQPSLLGGGKRAKDEGQTGKTATKADKMKDMTEDLTVAFLRSQLCPIPMVAETMGMLAGCKQKVDDRPDKVISEVFTTMTIPSLKAIQAVVGGTQIDRKITAIAKVFFHDAYAKVAENKRQIELLEGALKTTAHIMILAEYGADDATISWQSFAKNVVDLIEYKSRQEALNNMDADL
eukprot:s428_g27.t1